MINMTQLKVFDDKEFDTFCKFIYEIAGINLTDKKRSLVTNRLRKRVVANEFNSYGDYFKWVRSAAGNHELVNMINAITTNITTFYRDAKQFAALNNEVLPLIRQKNNGTIRVWSAGCSTGEEPYTIAMQLIRFGNNVKFEILATDLSTSVLEIADRGIYSVDQFKDVGKDIISEFFTVEGEKYIINSKVKQHVSFKKLNLITDSFPQNMDIIFCRNVVIYFDRTTKTTLFDRYWNTLKPHGFLFLGHSESLFNNSKYKFFKPSIYKRVAE